MKLCHLLDFSVPAFFSFWFVLTSVWQSLCIIVRVKAAVKVQVKTHFKKKKKNTKKQSKTENKYDLQEMGKTIGQEVILNYNYTS